jgi:crotonobetaine/carnitine-CoA ligase
MIELPPEERVLPMLLERQAERLGDRPLLTSSEGTLSYRELRDDAARLAGGLAAHGVSKGDRVAVIAENRIEVLQLFVACAWLGAILVPINPAFRGNQLAHVLRNSEPYALVVEAEQLHQLRAVGPLNLKHIWLLGPNEEHDHEGRPIELFPHGGSPIDAATVQPGDPLAIMYTSGTTGPSKGVCCPHAQFYWWGLNTGRVLGIRPADTLYTCLPLFHTNALNAFVQALVADARFVLGPRFSASQFWPRVSDAGATITYLLGAMVSILVGREPAPMDRAHSVRVALAPATPPEVYASFANRFGVELIEGHGMTETNLVIGPRDGLQRPGSMGRVMPGFEARVVDPNDTEVVDGAAGELVMRPMEPFSFANGYWGMPDETVAAWRNLWFHSGDRVRRDSDGYFWFVDRMKDTIRRRGENISAWEVERVLETHPSVAAAAVIPVPASLGEDEVMCCVVPHPSEQIDPYSLITYCEGRLAYFAIPRYIEIMSELPLTENGKVQKFALRARGVTELTWDREEAGYKLDRQR